MTQINNEAYTQYTNLNILGEFRIQGVLIGANTTPQGPTNSVQYNAGGGNFGGDSGLLFNPTTKLLDITGVDDIGADAFTISNASASEVFSIDTLGSVIALDFNGVVLTGAGVATNFLNETGAYSVPPDTITNPAGASTQIQFNTGGVFDAVDYLTFNGATLVVGDGTNVGNISAATDLAFGAQVDGGAFIGRGTDDIATIDFSFLNNSSAVVFSVDNLGAVVGSSFNSVPLTSAGVATNFLDESGNYSVPAGTATNPAGANTEIQFNNSGSFGAAAALNWDGTSLDATQFNGIALTTGGVATNFLDETGNYSTPAGGSPSLPTNGVQFRNAGGNFDASAAFTYDDATLTLSLNGDDDSTGETLHIDNNSGNHTLRLNNFGHLTLGGNLDFGDLAAGGVLTGTGTDDVGATILELLNNSGANIFSVDTLGATLGLTFNGVALTTGGVASNFLDETGNYSVPAGGGTPVTLNADDPTQQTLTLSGQELQVSLATPTTDGAQSAEDKTRFDAMVAASTGVKTGGVLSAGTASDEYSITDGTGQIIDSDGSLTSVSWSGKVNIVPTNIATQLITFVGIDSSGNVVEQTSRFTSTQARTIIVLGVAVHVNNVDVDTVNNEQHVIYNVASQYGDLVESIGFFNINGNIYSPNVAADLTIDKSSGDMYGLGVNYQNNIDDPNVLNLASLSLLTFQYRFSDGSSGVTGTDIDPTNLDDGAGGLTPLSGNNKWSIQRIYSFTSNNVKIQRGQEEFGSKEKAIAGIASENFVTEPSIVANGLLRGFLVCKKDATDLTNTGKAVFIEASKFQSAGGSSGSAPDFQEVYGNSTAAPELITDAINGAVNFRGGTGDDDDLVFTIQNNAGTNVATWDAGGNQTLTNLQTGAGTAPTGLAAGTIWGDTTLGSAADPALRLTVAAT